jgi:hypothetical protein
MDFIIKVINSEICNQQSQPLPANEAYSLAISNGFDNLETFCGHYNNKTLVIYNGVIYDPSKDDVASWN